MSQIICHRCGELKDKKLCSPVRVWVGAIKAKKENKMHCHDCMAELRAEQEENRAKDYDGEDWKPGYDADADDEERWKDDE